MTNYCLRNDSEKPRALDVVRNLLGARLVESITRDINAEFALRDWRIEASHDRIAWRHVMNSLFDMAC